MNSALVRYQVICNTKRQQRHIINVLKKMIFKFLKTAFCATTRHIRNSERWEDAVAMDARKMLGVRG